jgi:hypothetical protein
MLKGLLTVSLLVAVLDLTVAVVGLVVCCQQVLTLQQEVTPLLSVLGALGQTIQLALTMALRPM